MILIQYESEVCVVFTVSQIQYKSIVCRFYSNNCGAILIQYESTMCRFYSHNIGEAVDK